MNDLIKPKFAGPVRYLTPTKIQQAWDQKLIGLDKGILVPRVAGGTVPPFENLATLAETTTTADPGVGAALAVTSRTTFPQTGQFAILVQNSETDKTNREVMLVTAGQGSGAG